MGTRFLAVKPGRITIVSNIIGNCILTPALEAEKIHAVLCLATPIKPIRPEPNNQKAAGIGTT